LDEYIYIAAVCAIPNISYSEHDPRGRSANEQTYSGVIMMLDKFLLALTTLISPTTCLPPPADFPIAHTHQQLILLPKPNQTNQPLTSHFRPATESDLSAITTITVEAFSPSADWHYLVPDIDLHKRELWNCLYEQIVSGWEHFDRNKTFINIITVPSSKTKPDNDDQEESEIPVSFAVWNMRASTSSSSSSSSSPSPSSSVSVINLLLL
jgi:hypothetical protein